MVALYLTNDSQHGQAKIIANKLASMPKTIVIHPYVVEEVATILAYRVGTALSQRFLIDLTASTESTLFAPVVIKRDIEFFQALNKKISFADATIIYLAKQMNSPILTFDKQMLSILKNL